MNKQKLILGLFVLSLLGLAFLISNANALTYKENSDIDLKVPCSNDGVPCSAQASCNITILFPNSTTLINAQPMTNFTIGYFNYTLNSSLAQTTPIGEYYTSIFCQDGAVNGASTFNYLITYNGKEPPTAITIIIFSLIFAVLILAVIPLFLWTYYHFSVKGDYDVKDLCISIAYYLGVFIFYILQKEYMGNQTIDTLTLWIIDIGSIMFVFIPLILFAVTCFRVEKNRGDH